MSKSYTSYRLRHLLKVSSRAPRSRHTDVRQPDPFSLPSAPREHIGRKARNIRIESSRRVRRGKEFVPQIDIVATRDKGDCAISPRQSFIRDPLTIFDEFCR